MFSTEKLSGMKMETSFLINMSGASPAASRRIRADFHHALLSRTRCLPFLSARIMITHQRLLCGYRGGWGGFSSQVEVLKVCPAHETSGCWLYCECLLISDEDLFH